MTFEHDIQRAAELVSTSSYAVALTGAGVSTPSGIPDFRSPGSGLWEKVNPLLVASFLSFRLQPQAFYDWARPLARKLLEAEPNPAHHALAELEEMGLLRAVITQNIDGLHQRAGSKRVLELHGHLREATCLQCHKVVPAQGLIEAFLERGEVPRCPCGGLLRPNVVLFGELLPKGILLEAWGEAERCDLMLVAGSSLEVAPASEIPLMARRSGARIIIVNYQETCLDRLADVVIHEDVAEVLPQIVEACRGGL
ncbi:MAG TPA: NAD-dependent protein deacylase [Anaerolineae bacterium]|nr:NAD-dependent protein deacylase [Anaerolineae bacterium]